MPLTSPVCVRLWHCLKEAVVAQSLGHMSEGPGNPQESPAALEGPVMIIFETSQIIS